MYTKQFTRISTSGTQIGINLHGGTGGARTQGCVGSVGERSSCRFSSSDSETPVGCVSSFPMPRTAVPRQGSFCTRVPRGQVRGAESHVANSHTTAGWEGGNVIKQGGQGRRQQGGVLGEGGGVYSLHIYSSGRGRTSIRSIYLLSMHAQWYRSNAKFPIVSSSIPIRPGGQPCASELKGSV